MRSLFRPLYPGSGGSVLVKIHIGRQIHGIEFALLPPNNADGNFAKTVLRVVVRNSIEDPGELEGRLWPGIPVISTIDRMLLGGWRT